MYPRLYQVVGVGVGLTFTCDSACVMFLGFMGMIAMGAFAAMGAAIAKAKFCGGRCGDCD